MANTYTLIEAKTLTTTTASVTFTSIPQTYTDLMVLLSVRGNQASSVNSSFYLYFNGSTSNYTGRRVYGNGSTVASDNDTVINLEATGPSATSSTFANIAVYIPNYTSTTTAKSVSIDNVTENNATTAYPMLTAGLWNPSTQAAITQIEFDMFSTNSFVADSTFYLYGISNS